MSVIRIRGARAHNLQDLDLVFEHGRWHAVTGLSGSGKSSVVFDTLVREGQRRFLGALSSRARLVLGKLGEAEVDAVEGLPPAIAIGQGRITRHGRSTVGTLTGVLDLLRLWYAREGVDPEGATLSRSLFSFNSAGACPACDGLGVEDLVDPALVVADPSKSIRDGALVPTLKNGYTVYSQVTLEVMNQICEAHGFDVHTPWSTLTDAQRDVILYGTDALVVPFGKHSIESRMKWKGITARPREEGHYRGLIPVITETLKRSRNPNILRFVRSVPCSACEGSRFGPIPRRTTLGDHSLPDLLQPSVHDLRERIAALPASAVAEAIRPSIEARLRRMVQLGLGHLSLDRGSPTLSAGEAQRVRLVSQLSTELSGFLIALDEPTLGLHPTAHAGMAEVLDEAVERGNTVIVVEHDPDMARRADRVLAVGPGAGPHGGRLVYDGDAAGHDWGAHEIVPPDRGEPEAWVQLAGATLHNLQSVDLSVAVQRLTVVQGPSGAGKSSLVFGTLLPALQGVPGAYGSIAGPELLVQSVDAAPIGRTPRSTPATWTGLFDLIRKRFAAEAKGQGWGASRFSFNTKAGRCEACEGLGVERIGLHLMRDVERPCAVCEGGRYAASTLAVHCRGLDIAQTLQLRAEEALERWSDDPPVAALLQAMCDLGLGYLRLGQSSTTLSRGEAQRIKLATLLGGSSKPGMVLLDEPDRGLHPADVARLVRALHRLVDEGHTVVAVSHHRALWAAADALVALDDGRRVQPVRQGPDRPWRAAREPVSPPATIALTGVRTHTLDLDVRIPRGALTVVAGVSGSGKSSLVFDTLAAEAWHRFAESLPFEVRRHVRKLPRPVLDRAIGLGPTLALEQVVVTAAPRSTVGIQTGIDPWMRLLWARSPEGRKAGLSAAHFSPNRPLGACEACEGRGVVARCSVDKLVTAPDKPLFEGAMSSTRPGRFFGEPDGRFRATLAAATPDVDWSQPWSTLPEAAREVALRGAGDRVFSVQWSWVRGKRSGEHSFEGPWEGLLALVEAEARVRARARAAAEWAEPLADQPCPRCEGDGLRELVRAIRLDGRGIGEARRMSLAGLAAWLPTSTGIEPVVREITRRLEDLTALGLGHLSLHRATATLSGGEHQRVRLAAVLRSGLAGMTLALDEPTAGLHASEVEALLGRLHALRAQGHTVVVVSHRPALIRAADHLIELGPGAGTEGGRVVAEGPPAEVLAGDTPTARALRQPGAPSIAPVDCPVRLEGVRLRNLALDLALPAQGLVAVTGVSGSGKSSLVFDVLAASAEQGKPVGCAGVVGLDRFERVLRPTSLGRGSTPLSALGLRASLKTLFYEAQEEAVLPKRAFSSASPAGRCTTCGGSGRTSVSMDVLADLQLACDVCEGTGLVEAVRAVRWKGLGLAAFLDTPMQALPELPAGLREAVDAVCAVGLGHLGMGRRCDEMSGGEAQRLMLASVLAGGGAPALVVLDEPARGLHEQDVAALVEGMTRLGRAGHLVVAVAHRLSLVRAASHVVDLGPGSGPQGGRLVSAGPPGLLVGGTAEALLRATRR